MSTILENPAVQKAVASIIVIGLGCVQPHDWCAACPHRRGDDCSQFALGLSRGWRKRGGAWHAGGAGRWRQYRCPRYAGPETEVLQHGA